MKQFPQHLIWAIFCSVQSLSVQRKAAGKESKREGKKKDEGRGGQGNIWRGST